MRSKDKSFRDLDGNAVLKPPQSPLEDWYIAVRDIPISKLTVYDLGRACRQNLFVDEVVPASLERLKQNPLAGELYDGELLWSMKSVDSRYWQTHPEDAELLLKLANIAYKATDNPKLQVSLSDLTGQAR